VDRVVVGQPLSELGRDDRADRAGVDRAAGAAARAPPLEALGECLTDAEQVAGLGALEAERPEDLLEVPAPGRPPGRILSLV